MQVMLGATFPLRARLQAEASQDISLGVGVVLNGKGRAGLVANATAAKAVKARKVAAALRARRNLA